MENSTIHEIVAAVNLEKVSEIALDIEDDEIDQNFIESAVDAGIIKPECVIKFVKFLQEVFGRTNFENHKKILEDKLLEIQKEVLKDPQPKDLKNLRKFNSIYVFLGHCYLNNLIDSTCLENSMILFRDLKGKNLIIQNFWQIVGGKFCENFQSLKDKNLLNDLELNMLKCLDDRQEDGIEDIITIPKRAKMDKEPMDIDENLTKNDEESMENHQKSENGGISSLLKGFTFRNPYPGESTSESHQHSSTSQSRSKEFKQNNEIEQNSRDSLETDLNSAQSSLKNEMNMINSITAQINPTEAKKKDQIASILKGFSFQNSNPAQSKSQNYPNLFMFGNAQSSSQISAKKDQNVQIESGVMNSAIQNSSTPQSSSKNGSNLINLSIVQSDSDKSKKNYQRDGTHTNFENSTVQKSNSIPEPSVRESNVSSSTIQDTKLSPELQTIEEILNYPNYETNQSSLDIIFLLNYQKIQAQQTQKIIQNFKINEKKEILLSCDDENKQKIQIQRQNFLFKSKNHQKIQAHLKAIENRHQTICNDNPYDIRHIDESQIDEIFKTMLDRIDADDNEPTIEEVVWLGSSFLDPKPSLESRYIKYFIMEVLKIVDTKIFADFLELLSSDHPNLWFIVDQIVDYCVEFLRVSEELLNFKIVTEYKVFQMIKFTAKLYNHRLIPMHKVLIIINDLEVNNLWKFLKYFAFDISKEFMDRMVEELIRNEDEILKKFDGRSSLDILGIPEIQKIIKAKQSIIQNTKKCTKISIHLDELDDDFLQSSNNDYKDLIGDSIQKLIDAVIKRAINKPNTEAHLDFLRNLNEKYEYVPKMICKSLSSEIRFIFSYSTEFDVNWSEVNNVANFLIEISLEDWLNENDLAKVKVKLFNQVLNGFNNNFNIKINLDHFINLISDIAEELPEAYFNILEGLFDIYENVDCLTPLKFITENLLVTEGYDPRNGLNPSYVRFTIELFDAGKANRKVFENLQIKNSHKCAQDFIEIASVRKIQQSHMTIFLSIWQKQQLEGENEKFFPTVTEICREMFYNQHIKQEGKVDKLATIQMACFIREMFTFGLFTLQEFEECVLMVMHSVATEASLLNIKCFYTMVVTILPSLENILETGIYFLVTVLYQMIQKRTDNKPVVNLLLTRDHDEEILSDFDKLLERLVENGSRREKIPNFNFLANERIDTKFCEKIVKTVKKMNETFFDDFISILNIFKGKVKDHVGFYMMEQIFFETQVKQYNYYDWKALKNLTLFAGILYDQGFFEFSDMLSVYLNYFCLNLKDDDENSMGESSKETSKKIYYRKSFDLLERMEKYSKILLELLKILKKKKNFKDFKIFIDMIKDSPVKDNERIQNVIKEINEVFKK